MAASIQIELNGERRTLPCGEVLTIGRGSHNHLVLNDPRVSRNHALIRQVSHDNFMLFDGGSANGTYVDGQRITEPTLLSHGCDIQISKHHITFLYPEAADSQEEPITQDITQQHSEVNLQRITLLVSDIRGYSTLAEDAPIEMLSQLMNQWTQGLREEVRALGGFVEKFIGDCIYARWNNAQDSLGILLTAMRCAQAIRNTCDRLNGEFPELDQTLRIGVGIHTGLAAVDVGRDGVAIGDAVNLAFRLESATRELATDIVMGAAAYRQLAENFWREREQEISVKGRRQPVSVIGLSFEELGDILRHYESAPSS